jgi:hypothetical protein
MRPASYLHTDPKAWLADVLARTVDHKIVIDVRQSFEEGANISEIARRHGVGLLTPSPHLQRSAYARLYRRRFTRFSAIEGETRGTNARQSGRATTLELGALPWPPGLGHPALTCRPPTPGCSAKACGVAAAPPQVGGRLAHPKSAYQRCVAWSRAECRPRR